MPKDMRDDLTLLGIETLDLGAVQAVLLRDYFKTLDCTDSEMKAILARTAAANRLLKHVRVQRR